MATTTKRILIGKGPKTPRSLAVNKGVPDLIAIEEKRKPTRRTLLLPPFQNFTHHPIRGLTMTTEDLSGEEMEYYCSTNNKGLHLPVPIVYFSGHCTSDILLR